MAPAVGAGPKAVIYSSLNIGDMSAISKVVVVQSDRRVGQAVRLGFEREGAEVVVAGSADEAARALPGVALVVAGSDSAAGAAALIGRIAEARAVARSDAPVLYVGNGATRREALEAGADEVLSQPVYVRDVVTVGKLLAGMRPGVRSVVQGDLGDTFGVFYLVRALSAIGRSAVLSLVRGLRRGEVRFFEGEVTSAAVGALHGQAALHQLLLWTEARFELRWEDVVRRRQIPLERDELLRDAERFLTDIREVAGGLSPAVVYEQDPGRLAQMSKQIPTEVHGVLRLFDGHRTIADVIEDCPYRVFETLRVAQRAEEVGLIRRVHTARPKSAIRAVLAVEEWLVGTDAKVPAERPETSSDGGGGKKGKKKKKNRTLHGMGKAGGVGAGGGGRPAAADIDWGALVPRSVGVEMIGLAGVVPSEKAAGEINVDENAPRARRASGALQAAEVAAKPEAEAAAKAKAQGEAEAAAKAEAAAAAKAEADAAAAAAAAKAEAEAEAAVREAAARERLAREEEETAAQRAVRRRAETSGELPVRSLPDAAAAAGPVEPGPSILVDDLAAAHTAIMAVTQQAAQTPGKDASGAPAEASVDRTRTAAVAAALAATHFTEDEEAFFSAGASETFGHSGDMVDTFADLDEGYRRVSFWERLFGGWRRKKRAVAAPPSEVAPAPKRAPAQPQKKSKNKASRR